MPQLPVLALSSLATAVAETWSWRSATYVQGGNTKAIYGGMNTKEVFSANGFDGPLGENEHDWIVLWTHRHQVTALKSRTDVPYKLGRFLNHCEYFTGAGHKGQLAGHMHEALKIKDSPYPEVRRLRSYQIQFSHGLSDWSRSIRELGSKQHWLIKPSTAGHSKGIQLLDAEEAARQSAWPQAAVAQEYLEDGLLLDNRKFHLRLYIFVPRWAPLSLYIFDDGVVFHSKHKYKKQRSVEADVFSGVDDNIQVSALRDVLVEVASEGKALLTCKADAKPEDCEAPDVPELRRRLRMLVEEAFGGQDVLKTTFGDPKVTIPSKKGTKYGCFDLFGADVMFDQKLRPALLEINSGPNLWIDGEGKNNIPLQRSIKGPLVHQIAGWLKGVVGTEPLKTDQAEALEKSVLLNFTRVF